MKLSVGHRYLVCWKRYPYIQNVLLREWTCQEIRETAIKFRDCITNEVFWKERSEMESRFQIVEDLGLEPGYKPLEL